MLKTLTKTAHDQYFSHDSGNWIWVCISDKLDQRNYFSRYLSTEIKAFEINTKLALINVKVSESM